MGAVHTVYTTQCGLEHDGPCNLFKKNKSHLSYYYRVTYASGIDTPVTLYRGIEPYSQNRIVMDALDDIQASIRRLSARINQISRMLSSFALIGITLYVVNQAFVVSYKESLARFFDSWVWRPLSRRGWIPRAWKLQMLSEPIQENEVEVDVTESCLLLDDSDTSDADATVPTENETSSKGPDNVPSDTSANETADGPGSSSTEPSTRPSNPASFFTVLRKKKAAMISSVKSDPLHADTSEPKVPTSRALVVVPEEGKPSVATFTLLRKRSDPNGVLDDSARSNGESIWLVKQ